MAENNSKFAGLRYARLVRCSTDPQADASIPDQIDVLDAGAKKLDLVHAGPQADFILPGISGSHPAAREDIDQIIRRKREINDFDVLLVQDLSRLTREGVEHGGKLEYDLAAAGTRLIFVGTHIPEGEHAGILKSVEYYAAQQFAKSVSLGAARGQMSAIIDGRQTHCLRPPFAVDRLYMSSDGRKLHLVRNLTNGTQQKLDATTLEVLQTYPKPIKGQSPLRCRKQAGERVVLIPDATDAVETVRLMFKRLLIDDWGDWRIAKELNDLGIPSANGKRWMRNSVKMLLHNPIYTGVGLANRRSAARYHQRAPHAPSKLAYDLIDVAQKKRPPNRHRPKSDWVEQRHPELECFLDAELRDRAIAFHASILTGAPKAARTGKDKHVDSLFILKGVLHSKQGGIPMTGRTQGTKEKPYRYYHVSRSSAYPSSDKTTRRIIRAEPIEQAVLAAIQEILTAATVREQIIEIVGRQYAVEAVNDEELERLRTEQAELSGKIEFIIDSFGSVGKDAAKNKIQQLEAKLANVNARIAAVAPRLAPSRQQIEVSAHAAAVQLSDLASNLGNMSMHTLRELIGSVVVRLEVDLETLAVVLELALPAWATVVEEPTKARLGLGGNFLRTSAVEAQFPSWPRVAAFECVVAIPKCYRCQRRAA